MAAADDDGRGSPFASPFQFPGAAPAVPPPTGGGGGKTTKAEREARLRAYDEAFQQDARDRDAYYGRIVVEKRAKALQEARERRDEMGVDAPGSRFAGPATLEDLTRDLLQRDPATMTAAEYQEFQVLQRRAERQPGKVSDGGAPTAADASAEAPRETADGTPTPQQLLQAVKERQKQEAFERRMDALDDMMDRK